MKIALLFPIALLVGGCATTPLVARETASLYCNGYLSANGEVNSRGGVAALLQISANDFRLDIEGFGHGEAKGRLKRAF